MDAHDFARRGDGYGFGGHRGYGYGAHYFNPYYYNPVVFGSYYQRPYPYHFDYYRYRWGAPQVDAGFGGYSKAVTVTSDCPCADESAIEAVPQPSP